EIDEAEKDRALAVADVALNPVLSGSGTNLKILEYAAAGLPTVTTPVGIRGLTLTPDRDVIVTEPDEFADALRRLRSDPEVRRRLARSARATVVAQYDWKAIGRTMIQTMESRIPPPGPMRLDFASESGLTAGWYGAENWEDAGDGPGIVRWTADSAECIIASPVSPADLHMTVHAHIPGQPLTVTAGHKTVYSGDLNGGWQQLILPWNPEPGIDMVRIYLQTNGWSPADEGSPDSRRLGIAVSHIEFRQHS
nr:glycosyltransferase family 4 protein [bacterium]